MLRRPILVAALAACLLVPTQVGARAGAGEGVDALTPVASVRVSSCSRVDHSASFYGRMNRLAAADRMAMRFTLLQHAEHEPFAPVHAPGLGRWRKSKHAVRGFGYRQRVRGLADGSLYRMQVDFRWYDEEGAVIRRTRRRSRTCNQVGPLPNLRVKIIDSAPTPIAGVSRYEVRVANRGAAAAQMVDVAFEVDSSAVDTQTVAALDPDQTQVLTFRGPACENGVKATVDPGGTVRETDEHDNVQALSCSDLALR
jgi:hypothetical protein